ncbi:MAG: hypothetical protein E7173_00950 [Firmicutes bacterium]|nr:hypothetical protein [Bacillota bacterium]
MITFNEINKHGIIELVREHKFELHKTIGLDSKYTFGIEIEFEKAPLDSLKNTGHWKLEDETVISKNTVSQTCGGELVSPILTDNPNSWLEIQAMCSELVNNGAVTSEYTGGHIHIGSQIIGSNPDNIRIFLKMWELFEREIYYFSYGYDDRARLGVDRYAKPVGKQLNRLRTSKTGYNRFTTFYCWMNYFRTHYTAKFEGVSFKNFRGCEMDEGNTIEIRCPNGTLNPIIWQNNVNFFTRLMLSCRADKVDEQLLDYLLFKKKSSDLCFENFNIPDIGQAVLFSNMIYDDEIEQLTFLKQCLKLFTEDEKNKNYSL